MRFLILSLFTTLIMSCSADKQTHPPEVGPIEFLRDYKTAVTASKKEGKPIFAFFQEVPG